MVVYGVEYFFVGLGVVVEVVGLYFCLCVFGEGVVCDE